MNVHQLSTTLIGNWEDCPSRAWASYMKRLEFGDDNEGTDATRFGTVVHNTCEAIHQDLLEADALEQGDRYVNALPDEYILEKFNEHWKLNTCYNFEYYVFGTDRIVDFIRRTMVARLGVTIATEFLFVLEVETRKVWKPRTREEGNTMVKEILRRGNTPIVSKIDRIDRWVNETGTHYQVHDYKTNILPFTRDYIENSTQLGIYDIVVRTLFPDATDVECVFDMLRHGRFPVTFDDDFRTKLSGYLINLWSQIAAAEVPEERLNKYCRWCEIRSGCATYGHALTTEVSPVLTETTDTEDGINKLYEQYEQISCVVKLAEERKKEIAAMIVGKIQNESLGEPLQVGRSEFYLQQNPRYEYDKQAVFRVFGDFKALALLPTVMSISKTSVEKGLKSRPELRDALGAHLKKNFVTPTLKRRRLEGGTSKNTEEPDAAE